MGLGKIIANTVAGTRSGIHNAAKNMSKSVQGMKNAPGRIGGTNLNTIGRDTAPIGTEGIIGNTSITAAGRGGQTVARDGNVASSIVKPRNSPGQMGSVDLNGIGSSSNMVGSSGMISNGGVSTASKIAKGPTVATPSVSPVSPISTSTASSVGSGTEDIGRVARAANWAGKNWKAIAGGAIGVGGAGLLAGNVLGESAEEKRRKRYY